MTRYQCRAVDPIPGRHGQIRKGGVGDHGVDQNRRRRSRPQLLDQEVTC